MATVIDALVVTLGLDAEGLRKGQREAADAHKKIRGESDKTAKAAEALGKKVGESFGDMARQAMTFFAVLAGAKSMKDFIASTTQIGASLGRMATNVDASAKTIQSWGAAAERVGGNATGTAQSFERMSQALYDLKTNGKNLPTEIYRLTALTGTTVDTEHGPARAMEDIAKAAAALAKTDPSKAYMLLKGSGLFDEGTINLMTRFGDKIGDVTKSLERFGLSDAAVKSAEKLQESWTALTQRAGEFRNAVAERLIPIVTKIVEQMNAWFDANQQWLSQNIADVMGRISSFLERADWGKMVAGAQEFLKPVTQIGSVFESISSTIDSLNTKLQPIADFLNSLHKPPENLAASRDEAKDGGWYQGGPGGIFSFKKGGIADWAAGKLSGARATGGPVSGGKHYLVGERGPELFTPGASGFVTPNGALGGDNAMQVGGRDVSRGNPMPVMLVDVLNGIGALSKGADSLLGQGGDVPGGVGGRNGDKARARRNRVTGAVEITPGKTRIASGNLAANQKEAYTAARAEGLSDTAARAFVANVSGEALHKPSDYHMDTDARGRPAHMASGIVQWDPRRAAAIKQQFGRMPHEMSVGDQTKAAIWEMKNKYPTTWRALNGGGSAESMVGTLVSDYERPANVSGSTAARLGYLRGLKVGGATATSAPAPSAASPPPASGLLKRRSPEDVAKANEENRRAAIGLRAWRGSQSLPMSIGPTGAGLSAMKARANISTNTSTSSVHIGKVDVNTAATDAKGIAGDFADATHSSMMAMLANSGQA